VADITAGMTESEKAALWKPKDLFQDPKDWVPAQFKSGSDHDIKRRYVARTATSWLAGFRADVLRATA
jgi:hypothetical protein